ncbi:MAG TPA: response regulator [Chthoniobacterales bacterium]|nr:response regulator [Chthoniobacterales bacterium]
MKPARIRALIVDDEALARRFIGRMLKDDDEIEVIGECSNGKEALAMIRKEKPDLVFLDVQMPEMDGIAVLQSLRLERLPQIVFTTAYEQYAIRAFELHALDYLLKPFDQPRFRDAVECAKEQVHYRRRKMTAPRSERYSNTSNARQSISSGSSSRRKGGSPFCARERSIGSKPTTSMCICMPVRLRG